MPNVVVECAHCKVNYTRKICPSLNPKRTFCSRKCKALYTKASGRPKVLVDTDLRVLAKIKEVDGISTNELKEALDMDYTNVLRATSKLWHMGLVGEIYSTWTTNREEATEGEFKVMISNIS